MARIRLLKEEYIKGGSLFEDFIKNKIHVNNSNFDSIEFEIPSIEPFPLYLATKEEVRQTKYLEAFRIFRDYYLQLDREIVMKHSFWQTLFLVHFRDYLVKNYPTIVKSKSTFYNIIQKDFDWENYIYKIIFFVQYVEDHIEEIKKEKYYNLIIDNLDVMNYILKYPLFRYDQFFLNILTIIDKNDISTVLKKKITHRPDLGKDVRYGRRVLFEINKDYPVVVGPMLPLSTLENTFIRYLNVYLPK